MLTGSNNKKVYIFASIFVSWRYFFFVFCCWQSAMTDQKIMWLRNHQGLGWTKDSGILARCRRKRLMTQKNRSEVSEVKILKIIIIIIVVSCLALVSDTLALHYHYPGLSTAEIIAPMHFKELNLPGRPTNFPYLGEVWQKQINTLPNTLTLLLICKFWDGS